MANLEHTPCFHQKKQVTAPNLELMTPVAVGGAIPRNFLMPYRRRPEIQSETIFFPQNKKKKKSFDSPVCRNVACLDKRH